MNTCMRCGRRELLGFHRCEPPLVPLRVPASPPPTRRSPAPRPALRQPPVPPARGPRVPEGIAGPPRRRGQGSGGVVASRPAVVGGGVGIDGAIGTLTLLLLCLTVLVTPALLFLAVMLLAVFLVVGWLLGRIGMLWALLLLRPRGRGPAPEVPSLAFRTDTGNHLDDVRLRGHSSGIALGDEVVVQGVRLGGIVHAARVTNLTTGVVLVRRGLGRLVFLALVDLWLALSIASALASR